MQTVDTAPPRVLAFTLEPTDAGCILHVDTDCGRVTSHCPSEDEARAQLLDWIDDLQPA